MATRNGKIAHLTDDIREQLNLRLLEGETAAELAAWLNALPEVQSVLNSQFNGAPISEVNLTHWRQGGYLQWRTERECFDSARALADGDCDLAKTGLSAERLLNILVLRYGQLLMRWDFSPEEGTLNSVAFSEVTRKARILQSISRFLLAIHRIQAASLKSQRGNSSPDSMAQASTAPVSPAATSATTPRRSTEVESRPHRADGAPASGIKKAKPEPDLDAAALYQFPEPRGGAGRQIPMVRASRPQTTAPSSGARPEILSGPVSPAYVPLNLFQTPFKSDVDLAEVLAAVGREP